MAFSCLSDKGDCLRDLGRLDEAAAAHEECIRWNEDQGDDRGLAVGRVSLGTVRLQQRRYRDAVEVYAKALEQFTKLGEPGSVAEIWHQTGRAYREIGQPEAAEDAYYKALAIHVQLGRVGLQAGTLIELGILHHHFNHLEEAASLFRNAADKLAAIGDMQAEGRCRNNLGDTMRRLGRWDEARQAIHRAIECKEPFGHAAEPWTTWAILAAIEVEVGNVSTAAHARANAVAVHLAYRRDGGENHNADGRISLAVLGKLRAGNAARATSDLEELMAHPELPDWLRPFVVALQAIVAGSRDRRLAEAPDLHCTSAAELLHLIEVLEADERVGSADGSNSA
jgi:tetratricopeptide (TPR) repeat protein